MTFIWFVVAMVGLVVGMTLFHLWVDERDRKLADTRSTATLTLPALKGTATPIHPSIDPYLADLRAYLLQPPLPQGPGEMAERVYTHLNQWVNERLTQDADNTVDLAGELLTAPGPRFVDMSRNEAAPPPGYLEDLMGEEQP